MSLVGASGVYVLRDASLPGTAVVTCCWWTRLSSIGTGQYIHEYSATAEGDGYIEFGFGPTTDLSIETNSGGITNFGSTPSTGSWFFCAYSNNGAGAGNCIAYWASPGATTFNTATTGGTSFTPADLRFMNSRSNEWSRSDFSNLKVWSAVLTQQELFAEMNSMAPKRYADLHLWAPLWSASDVVDYGGTGHTPTAGGSPSSTDNPPVGFDEEADYYTITAAAPPANTTKFFFAAA